MLAPHPVDRGSMKAADTLVDSQEHQKKLWQKRKGGWGWEEELSGKMLKSLCIPQIVLQFDNSQEALGFVKLKV